jgi:oxygen-dependent protoporphyrinogen oxidase
MSSVVVVGGGVAGLAAARQLSKAGVDQVTVVEAGPRFGGKLAGLLLDGVRLDGGAESVLARRPEAVELIEELAMRDRLVHPTKAKPQVLVGGAVRPLPSSVMGVPRDLDELVGFLTPQGLARAREEPDLPAPALTGDVGIGAYLDARLGPEVTDRLLEPLLGGVYAGHARHLSFEAVSSALFDRVRQGGSLVEHARAMTATAPQGPVFAGLTGGISALADALVADLDHRGVTLRPRTTVRELVRAPSGGFRLVCGAVPTPEIIGADAVVLASPAGVTGRLLASCSPVSPEFAAIPYASMAVVTVAVSDAVLEGSGLLVPPGELPTIKAFTYSSNKWDWVSECARQAWGTGTGVVRASVGRLGEERLLQLDDEPLLRRTFDEARTMPGWAGAHLVCGQVTRWGGALPQYRVGHRGLVARLRTSLTELPGLAVCGAALDGVGVAACLASATAAAAKIMADLGRAGPVTTIDQSQNGRRSTP